MSAVALKAAPPVVSGDELEAVETAVRELTRLYAEADARAGRIGRRLREVRSGAVEVRRRHARNYLDAYLPPLKIVSIERTHEGSVHAEPPTLLGLLGLLRDSLSDVLRIWWGRHFKRWWYAR
jgi:hypothetical protein